MEKLTVWLDAKKFAVNSADQYIRPGTSIFHKSFDKLFD